jgi:hypothetical protein
MQHRHLWHVQHSASPSSSSSKHRQQQHHVHDHDVPTLYFNPPTPVQQELYFKTYGAERENEENKRDLWGFDFLSWGASFEPNPNEPNLYIPDPEKIHQIKDDGHCLFR